MGAGFAPTVIHSLTGTTEIDLPPHWVVLPDTAFYGIKFQKSLELRTGEHMLHIQADANCEDWPGLVRRFVEVLGPGDTIGLWTPEVFFTPFTLRRIKLAAIAKNLFSVGMVDGIVWGMSSLLLNRLGKLDFSGNPLGGGAEVFASAYCRTRGLLLVHDTTFFVSHPRGSGYSTDLARSQSATMAAGQLSDSERIELQQINALFTTRIKKEKSSFLFRLRRDTKKLLDYAYQRALRPQKPR